MKKITVGVLAVLVALGLVAASSAQDAKTDMARIQKTLQTRLPKITIEKVQSSQWPWLYEVITDDELFYTDATGDYLFYGKVMDTKTREDLTTKRWNDMLKVEFKDLPLSLAMKQVKGNGSRKLVVFADPDCPFCVRFEKTLQETTNITVYTFLFPLESIHPGAMDKARKIWCAPDRQSTWIAWMMTKKELPQASDCNTEALNTLVKLGEKLKVNGTPTLIFEDGHRVPGSIDKERLEEEFAAVAATPKG